MSAKLWLILLGAKALLIAGLAIDCQATDTIIDRSIGTAAINPIVKQARVSLPAEHASVRFAPNDSTLTPEAAAILDIQADILRSLPRAPVWIYGYADPDETSLAEAGRLARQRAEAVRDYLLAQGAELKGHRIFAAVAERKSNPSLLSKIERPARYATTFMLPWAE